MVDQLRFFAGAARVLEGVVLRTPVESSRALSAIAGGPVLLKCENLQRAGSFKIRGAYLRMSRLTDEEKARGVVAASAGNHAQGVAYHAQRLGLRAVIVMPRFTPGVKVERTRGFGAEVVLHGDTLDEALDGATLVVNATPIGLRDDAHPVSVERLPRGADPATHTKLGRGGLADVEWTVQLLQLSTAASTPELRVASTTEALDALPAAGALTEEDAAELRAAWELASRARNAVFLVRGKPGDQLPRPGPELVGVARACGYGPDEDAGRFVDDYRRVTRRARGVVDRVFYGQTGS